MSGKDPASSSGGINVPTPNTPLQSGEGANEPGLQSAQTSSSIGTKDGEQSLPSTQGPPQSIQPTVEPSVQPSVQHIGSEASEVNAGGGTGSTASRSSAPAGLTPEQLAALAQRLTMGQGALRGDQPILQGPEQAHTANP